MRCYDADIDGNSSSNSGRMSQLEYEGPGRLTHLSNLLPAIESRYQVLQGKVAGLETEYDDLLFKRNAIQHDLSCLQDQKTEIGKFCEVELVSL